MASSLQYPNAHDNTQTALQAESPVNHISRSKVDADGGHLIFIFASFKTFETSFGRIKITLFKAEAGKSESILPNEFKESGSYGIKTPSEEFMGIGCARVKTSGKDLKANASNWNQT